MQKIFRFSVVSVAFGLGGLVAIAIGHYINVLNWPTSVIMAIAATFGPVAAIGGAFWLDDRKNMKEKAELTELCKSMLRSVFFEIERAENRSRQPDFNSSIAREEIQRLLSTCAQALNQLHLVFPALARLDRVTLEMLIHFEYAVSGNRRIYDDIQTMGEDYGQILNAMLRTTRQPVEHLVS